MEQYHLLQLQLADTTLNCILVNDGSTLNMTPDDIDKLQESIPSLRYISYEENRGKGYAIRAGAKTSKSPIMAFTDIDFPYAPACFLRMYKTCVNGAAVVIGHRNDSYYHSIPKSRAWLSKGLRSLMKLFLNIPVSDTQSGLKFFNSDAKDVLLSTTINRYLFDLELIKMAARENLKIESVELSLREGAELGQMSLKILLTEFNNFIKVLLK